jgi:hypothetical protein
MRNEYAYPMHLGTHLDGHDGSAIYARVRKQITEGIPMTNALQREGGNGEEKRSQNESKRIQFEFSADALERMERLKEKTHTRSYAELIRDALRAYEWMVDEKEAGNEVGAIRGKEIVNVVKLFF